MPCRDTLGVAGRWWTNTESGAGVSYYPLVMLPLHSISRNCYVHRYPTADSL